MAYTNETTTQTLVSNWPYTFQSISAGEPHFKYLNAFATEIRYIDSMINAIYSAWFIDTASNRELEKLAAEVGIARQPGESDDDLRYRAALRKIVGASDGTARDIRAVVKAAFGADALDDVLVSHSTGDPVIQFQVPGTYIDDSALTRAELESEFERAFPASHGVTIVRGDTWLLGQSGSQGIGNGGLL